MSKTLRSDLLRPAEAERHEGSRTPRQPLDATKDFRPDLQYISPQHPSEGDADMSRRLLALAALTALSITGPPGIDAQPRSRELRPGTEVTASPRQLPAVDGAACRRSPARRATPATRSTSGWITRRGR